MAGINRRIRPVLGCGRNSIIVLSLVLSAGLFIPPHCHAARLGQFLTSKDLSRPVLLDQNGNQLQLSSESDPHPSLPPGSTPTYLAFPLYGGEHLPIGTPTIDSQTQAGSNSVGPLDFSTVVKAEVDQALSSSGLALVDAPKQNYLVEYVPHLAESHRAADSTSSRDKHQKTTNSSNSTLSKLLTASQWDKWADSGYSDLKKLLNINSSSSTPKPSTKKTNPLIEAQVLGSENPVSATGRVLPSAIPEPGGWMIFALLLGAAGLGRAWRCR
jgi:hypothetical protein